MEKYGPSSVTVQEAVAKMVDIDSVPEGVSLEEFLEAIVSDALDTCFENQRNAPLANETKESWEEYHRCTTLLDTMRKYLRDIESCVESGDPLLEIAQTDTIKIRLTTISVGNWSRQRHGIEIPDWEMYRGETKVEANTFDVNASECLILAQAIAALINEILCRAWRDWNSPLPFRKRRSGGDYFADDRPKAGKFKKPFIAVFEFDNPDGNDENWPTVSKRIKAAIKYLTRQETLKPIPEGGTPLAYKTLLGLVHIITGKLKSKASYNSEKPVPTILVRQFKYTQNYIRPEDLIACIEEAQVRFIRGDF